MTSYICPYELEEADGAWHAYVPQLESRGAATWGQTREEAIRNIQEVMQMVIEEMLEDGDPLPECVQVATHMAAAVTV